MEQRIVLLLIRSEFTRLTGNWLWDLHSDAVFCSDVMMPAPPGFTGTMSIVHPDDLKRVKEKLSGLAGNYSISLQFRIITTYGEIRTLTGENVFIPEANDDPVETFAAAGIMEKEKKLSDLQKEAEKWQLKKESYLFAERLTNAGTWFINTTSNETVYSDAVYRIYGLPPQSLNMHPHTFNSFIHPDDQVTVMEFFEKAYKEMIPLHLEFRIIRPDGTERMVRQSTHWSYSATGEAIIHGFVQDISEQKQWEHTLGQAQDELNFIHKIHKFQDQNSNTGYWYVNLLIRKTVYSDNYYRIYGLKPQAVPADANIFINCVHPDDRERVLEAVQKMKNEHTPPDIEYRIVRPDGKIRNIRQTGKLEMYAGREMVMIGIIQDITLQRTMEDKVCRQDEFAFLLNFVQNRSEEAANMGSFIWDLQSDKVTWSDHLYRLLGYKPHSLEPSPKLILKSVHPADHKKYTDELALVLQNQEGAEFEINIIQKGEIRLLKTRFTLVAYHEKTFLTGTFRDVTKEQKQQQQLSERIQLAEQLAENFPGRMFITDQNNNILLWNKACEEKFRQSKSTAEGRNFFEVFPHLKEEQTINRFREVLKGTAVYQHQVPTPARGYDDRYMIPLKNTVDEVTGILHILLDVTGEYKLKQQLNERLNFIGKLLDTAIDRIVALDEHMNYLYWNMKCEDFYGIKKEQVIGKNILEVFPNLLNDPTYNEFKKALRGETVHITANESMEDEYIYETWLIPVKNEKDAVTAVLWITHDFSKEYHLMSGQKKAFELLDSINEPCFEIDFETRLIYANKKAEQIWGKKREELLHRKLSEFFPQAIDSPLFIALNTVLEDKVEVKQEFFYMGLNRWIYLVAKPSDRGAVVLFIDIHQLKQTRKKNTPGTECPE